MEIYDLGRDKVYMERCFKMDEVERAEENIFKKKEKILPKDKKAKILLKPNLNNDLNTLTGNSTDLRLIVSVIKSLQKRGYKNLILADGPNCGITHMKIDVFKRLSIDKLCERFNVRLVDLNFTPYKEVELTHGNIAKVSTLPFEVDFMINMPKLKTHIEAKLTLAVKNLLGCFRQLHKRKIHDNLVENIVRMNEIIKPNLHILDGLIAMEGNGPGDGIPKKVGMIFAAENPFLLDLVISRLFNYDWREIPYLKVAVKKGHIMEKELLYTDALMPIGSLLKAKQNILSKILLHNLFVRPRYSRFFDPFFSGGPIPYILYKLKVRQDVYVSKDQSINKLELVNGNKLIKEKVKEYCPVGLDNPNDKKCIKCMYCYMLKPKDINYEGDLGYIKMQMQRFGKYFNRL